MADEFQLGSGNWWDSTRNRFDSGSSAAAAAPMSLSSSGSFGWPTEIVDTKARLSMDSVSESGNSINVFHDTQKLQATDSSAGALLAPDSNLQIMGLALPSQGLDWNQTLLRSEKADSSFRSMLQEDLTSTTSFQQEAEMGCSQEQWRQKIYSGSSEDSTVNHEFKPINRGFSLDQPQFSSHMISPSESTVTCPSLPTSFQMESSFYASSPSTMLQGLILGSDNQPQQSMNYPYPSSYGVNSGDQVPLPSWSKFPQFLRNSPPKQPPHSHLHFSNNAPFWNATAAAMNDVRSSFFPSLQMQLPSASYDEKPKITSEVRELAIVGKKSCGEPSMKRPRNETPSPLPAKVRKEKMGDRITALQQLVSPFGKTDTASVLSEAIEYIKFLHEQLLTTPYMKSGITIQHQQSSDKSKVQEGPKQDLRSRGLCLVPVSSTFPVAHDQTPVEFWTPTFGGTFR